MSLPVLVERKEQPCIAVRSFVTMASIGSTLPPLMPEIVGWLARESITPAGPPFWRYDVIDMAGVMEVEVGVPVAEPVSSDGDARIESGARPGGTYATVIHVGHPSSLIEATADLLEWGRREDVTWDMTYAPEGERWTCRLEEYPSDPVQVPDMGAWQTQLAFKLK
jgi:effector-binding domain-containing protein